MFRNLSFCELAYRGAHAGVLAHLDFMQSFEESEQENNQRSFVDQWGQKQYV